MAGDGGGGGAYGHMRGLAWEFAVVDNPAPNAFVVPGGKVGWWRAVRVRARFGEEGADISDTGGRRGGAGDATHERSRGGDICALV